MRWDLTRRRSRQSKYRETTNSCCERRQAKEHTTQSWERKSSGYALDKTKKRMTVEFESRFRDCSDVAKSANIGKCFPLTVDIYWENWQRCASVDGFRVIFLHGNFHRRNQHLASILRPNLWSLAWSEDFLMDLIIWPLIRLMQMSLFGGRARTWGRQNHFFSV